MSEDLLRESEEKYRFLAESSPEAIFLIDTNGFMTYLNTTAAIQFKADPSEIIGKHLKDIFPPDMAQENLAEIQNVISTKQPMYLEKEMKFPTGIIWLANRLTPVIKDNQVVSVLGLSIIITKQKMAELELRKVSRAVEQGPASVMITNIEGNINYVNQKFIELTGYLKEEVIGKNPKILNSGYHDSNFYENLWNTILSGKNWSGEIQNKKKNGEFYWVSVLISPLINSNGDITDFVAVKEDITEKKIMVSELIYAKEKAESANKLKDAFIANISHEIRTPLTGILGMSSLIRGIIPGEIKQEDEELFEGIELSSQRLIRTIDLILNYSRLQIGDYPLFPKNIDLFSICRNLTNQYSIEAKNKFIELIFQNKCDESIILADEGSVIMSISNLIGNAIKFSSRGSIHLILFKDNDDSIVLNVVDTGIGIGEDYLDKIFEPYRQEQTGYGRAYDGVGLGLALVKKVLNLNGAEITLKSIKGEGTTFSVNFGKAVKIDEGSIGKVSASNISKISQKISKTLILIVEDDSINQMTIKRFLDKSYNSILSKSSGEAIDLLKNNKIDLILMDISIQGERNGLELTKDLKSSKKYSHIPVIAITGHAFEVDRQNAMESGCDNFLAKPFSQLELLDMVNLYLPQ